MNINGLKLPPELKTDLARGGRQLADHAVKRLKKLFRYVESPLPILYSSYDDIIRENKFWSIDDTQYYLGVPSNDFPPGSVDPTLTLVFGDAEPDSPLALDYRTTPPRVVYLGDINHTPCWIELSSDYKSFVEMLETETDKYDGE